MTRELDLWAVPLAQVELNTRRLSFVNPAFCALTGHGREELVSKSDEDLTHPDDRTASTLAFERLARGEEPRLTLEKRYVRKDGSEVWTRAHITAMTDANNQPCSALVAVQDIDDLKDAEARLGRSQAKLQFLAALGDMARELDDPLEIIERMTRVVGERLAVARCAYTEASEDGQLVTFLPSYSAPEVPPIVGTFPLASFGPRVVREVYAGQTLVFHDVAAEIAPDEGAEAILAIGTHAFVACPILKRGHFRGTLFVSHTASRRWTDDDVKLLEALTERLWGTVARARAEAALRESEERMRLATEAAQVGMWFWEIPENRLTWTPICKRLFGFPPDRDVSYTRFLDAVYPDDRARVDAAVQRTLRELTEFRAEYRVVMPDGSHRVIAANGRCEGGPDGHARRMMGVALDVTERSRSEEARARLEAQLRQSQKLEALGTLAGGIAHDFNNILTAVNGNLDLAIADLPTDHPAQVSLAESRRAAERAGDLVRRILAFARPSKLGRRPLDPRPVVLEASRLLRAALPSMIEIRTELQPHVPLVVAEATELHQILMNLGTNARDAMPEGGVLTLRLETVRVDAHRARLAPGLGPGAYLRLTVQDTGTGMDPSTVERIYEPFFTTKPPGQGTGLGLSVVHGIVRSHGGAVVVSSTPGRGSTFDIYLPALEAPVIDSATPTIPAQGMGHSERLLYVDDEQALVFLMTRLLGRMGYRVVGANSATEALSAFDADPAGFDGVITDLGMPDMNGLDLAQAILRRRPDLPVIVTSGYVAAEDEERARVMGVREMILKPNAVEELGAALHRSLAAAGVARDGRRRTWSAG